MLAWKYDDEEIGYQSGLLEAVIDSLARLRLVHLLFLRLTATGTVNPVLGNIHRVTQRRPDLARRITCGESIGGRQPELVQHHIAHEGAAKMLTEFGRDSEREFRVLHSARVPALKVSERAEARPERRIRRRHLPRVRPAGDPAPTA
jgi:hypothetical protein